MKKSRKILCIIVFLILLSSNICYGSVSTSKLKQGDYIKLGIYNNTPIIWRVMGEDDNGIYLITDKVITFKAFSPMGTADGQDKSIWSKTVYSGATDRKVWGDPRWGFSSLRVWLNSTDKEVDYEGVIDPIKGNLRAVTVYPPDSTRKIVANEYYKEPGFLNSFEQIEKDAIATVSHKVLLHEFDRNYADGGSEVFYGDPNLLVNFSSRQENYDNAYYQIITEKVFCPSIEEMYNLFYLNGISVNTTPTAEAYEADESKLNNKLSQDDYVRYWLRTPDTEADTISKIYAVAPLNKDNPLEATLSVSPAASANEIKDSLYDQAIGVRPALYLKKNLSLSGEGSLKNPYYLVKSTIVEKPSEWAKAEIDKAIKNNLTTKSVTADYQSNITREEFCEVVMKLYDSLGGAPINGANNPFSDTSNSEVIRAYNAEIVGGTSETTFSPGKNLTREQLCVMLTRVLDKAKIGYPRNINFQDEYPDKESVSDWAYEAVRILNGYKILNGTENGLEPQGTVTKEVAVILIQRSYDKFK